MTRFQNRKDALAARNMYLSEDIDAFNGNKTARKNYVNDLKSIKLNDFQQDLVLGMILSDASVHFNPSKTACRIKMQQSHQHYDWLEFASISLLEYMGGRALHPVDNKYNKRVMFELDSLTCNAFDDIVNLTYNNYSQPKIIKPEIKPYISEVTVANWFNGDGGKRSHDRDKGITLNCQSFTEEECEILANAVRQNLGLYAYTKEDTHKSEKEQKYVVIISGTSYDSFIEKVGPYIHPCFKDKLPSGRSEKSHYGYMTAEKFNQLIGSKLVGNYMETYKRPNYI